MSIVQILSSYIDVFYGLLGLAGIWLAYEISRALKEKRRVPMPTEDAGWATPSPQQAWTSKTVQPTKISEVKQIQIASTADTDPLKQFFQKEHVTEPIITNISRPRKGKT